MRNKFLLTTLLGGFLLGGLVAPVSAAAQQTQCVSNALAGGTANAITIPLQPCALSTNLLILTASAANSGATTLRMAGYPALPVQDSQGNAIIAGTIPGAGAVVLLTSTGSAWKIVSGNATTGFSGVLTVPNGGTGLATIPVNGLIIGEGTGAISTVAAGATGTFLGGNTASPPSYKTISSNLVSSWSAGSTGFTPNSATTGAVTLAGTLGTASGGTGLTGFTTGDLFYASSSSVISKLGIGSTGNYLRVTAGLPAWTALTGDAVTSITFGTTGLTPSSPTAGAVTVAGTLGFANGGTSNTSYTNGQLLIGNTGTGGLSKAALTAGANTIITNGAGTITIASTGVSSGCGTIGSVGQILSDNGSGGCTSNAGLTASGGTLLAATGGVNLSGASAPLQFAGSAGASGYFAKSAGAATTPTWYNLLGSANTWTGKQGFAGTSSTLAASLVNAAEPATISATAATGTIEYDVCTQSVLYFTSSAAANWTLDLRCSSGTSLNSAMTTGDVVTVVHLVTQGGTAYYNNSLTVDGGAVTPKCQGGVCPIAGNVSGIDTYTYAIFKTGNAAFTVLESQVQFK